ncbi:type I-E CRISPR-associated protein Cas5/CasD [Bacillota bacterium Meth-B3]
MSTLLMRLAAPMQSWGVDAKYDRRGTERAPTKSGVIGLAAAALGRHRHAGIEDLAALRFGVRIDREGVLLRDYHTAKSSKSAYVTNRYYLCGAIFLAGLEGEEMLLLEIERALTSPRFPLFLGRRSCPPEGRISLGLREGSLGEALASEPPLAEDGQSRMRIQMDGEAGGDARFACDVPLSFDQRRREYGFRSVCEAYAASNTTPAQPPTLHDPMRELEG